MATAIKTKKAAKNADKNQYSDEELLQYRAKSKRLSFGKIDEIIDVPNLLAIQRESFDRFLGNKFWRRRLEEAKKEGRNNVQETSGLEDVFNEISPIEDVTGTMTLSFIDPKFEEPQYTEEECKEKSITYSAPLYVNAEFVNEETGEIKSQTVFMGDYPMMTRKGTFIINGIERVIVSQIIRSPGAYFDQTVDRTVGRKFYSAKLIPSRGAWLEFEYDKRDSLGIRIDRRRRQFVTAFLKAIGVTEEEIRKEFGEFPEILDMLEKDGVKTREEALLDVYRKTRPNDPPSVKAGETLLHNFFFNPKRYTLDRVGRYKLNQKLGLDAPADQTILDKEDIIRILKYLCSLHAGKKTLEVKKGSETVEIPLYLDDIDHFGNRRIRTVGELVMNQVRAGLGRLERVVRERMSTQNPETITPQTLINIRPLVASLREFFGSSQLSQFMDQNNPLAGLSHKRRLSALGPSGLSRDRAGMEVRDVHASHYGRMCPIESPEGANIGLIGALASYAVANPFGFLETPYRKVVKGKVTDEIVYLTADEEKQYIIAQANQELTDDNHFANEYILARDKEGNAVDIHRDMVDFIDVSPRQIVSIGTSLIPFLEHDDTNRALMGANMQRQAVPLVRTQAPYVGTGVEWRAAIDAEDVIVAEKPGVVTEIDADHAIVMNDDGTTSEYKFATFERSNQTTCFTNNAVAFKGDRVIKGSVLADGPATSGGELSLGTNLLVAFMSWEGYNYEDAIILSQRVVEDDLLTSIHIEEYEVDARDTKLGLEEITREIPNVSERMISQLDENGIVKIGAEVGAGDILVGKVIPKGEVELTAEERLLRAIFGEKSKEVRDSSLRVPHGEGGIVVGVTVLKGDEEEELPSGVHTLVRVYVASRRKITQGDKLSGRHGNKGVISKILPVEDMPFLEDGTPVDIILNPMGVPSRMNIGQVLEIHLGWLAKQGWNIKLANAPVDKDGRVDMNAKLKDLDVKKEPWIADIPDAVKEVPKNSLVATPVFDGATERAIHGLMRSQLPNEDGKRLVDETGKATLYDGRTGEPFADKISVGYMYILKLHHLVQEKIHARSTGPYSMITQQPLGGKAQFGGQRFGEMEVWALEAYGAAHTLHEMMTYKSDDVKGRVDVFEAIIKGDNIPEPGISESFKVLLREMQALGLTITIHDDQDRVLSLMNQFEPEKNINAETGEIDPNSFIEGDDLSDYSDPIDTTVTADEFDEIQAMLNSGDLDGVQNVGSDIYVVAAGTNEPSDKAEASSEAESSEAGDANFQSANSQSEENKNSESNEDK